MDGTQRQLWTNGGAVMFNETVETDLSVGLVINQGTADDYFFTMKSSDVSHAMTDHWEADTFSAMRKRSPTLGGLRIDGVTEGTSKGVELLAAGNSHWGTAHSTSGYGAIHFDAVTQSGNSYGATIANANLCSVSNNNSVKFIVDAEGDIHYDGSDAGAYDEFDDAQMTRAVDITRGKGVINSKFDKFISYNHEKLAEMQLVGREEDGSPNHFINITGMQRLHNGAIWQQYEKHENLLNAVYELAVEAVGEDKANEILDKNEIKLLSKNELLN